MYDSHILIWCAIFFFICTIYQKWGNPLNYQNTQYLVCLPPAQTWCFFPYWSFNNLFNQTTLYMSFSLTEKSCCFLWISDIDCASILDFSHSHNFLKSFHRFWFVGQLFCYVNSLDSLLLCKCICNLISKLTAPVYT